MSGPPGLYVLGAFVIGWAVWQHYGWPGSHTWNAQRRAADEHQRWLRASTADLLAEARGIVRGRWDALPAGQRLLAEDLRRDDELYAVLTALGDQVAASDEKGAFTFTDSGISPLYRALQERVGKAGT